MGRPNRVEEPNGMYHLASRGSNRQRIFALPSDRLEFLRLLASAVEKYEWICLAYCLMTNHYHLVIQIRESGLSRGMQWLNGGFSTLFNKRHACEAHLFRNRFGSKLFETEAHLLEACRYVVLNPVRAGLCDGPEDWTWSSYRATAGLEACPTFLADTEMLALFGPPAESARARYREFVAAGLPSPAVSDTVADHPQPGEGGRRVGGHRRGL